ncbi:AmpG family muropeptide MFS transporter [Kordiimonas aquimaris]|uniref:AmpG family muropeptide MFS transporter n=1 Tax=Kordiimonas aquimaris TaxID=707591 RepID=UPI0021D11AA0|nr:MFS transporter [Kordiimonas aquimaris]
MTNLSNMVIGLKPYAKRSIVATFGLGMSSGFPLTFVISLMGLWLSYSDVSKSDVGLFALITTFYTWKFLWSPAIDRMPLGIITRYFGQRRGWLFTIQALMAIALVAISRFDPATQLFEVAVIAAIIAFLSASQDIVIDAYRIEIIDDEEQGHSAAVYVYGYRTANFLAAIMVLAVAEYYGWSLAILTLPIMLIPGAVGAWIVGEPKAREATKYVEQESGAKQYSPIVARLREAVYLPFKEFTRRENWGLVLLFIFLFKAGDAVTAIMTAPLLTEMQFTPGDLLYANKTVGFITLMVGVGLGAILFKQIGTFKSLFLTGLLMMATNLVFAWLWLGEATLWRLAVTIGMENFATGLGTTVIIAYMASLCNANFTATQYALMSSLGNQARTLLGAPSGYVAEAIGWVEFFIYATLLALPGLILLVILWKKNVGMDTQTAINKSD